MDYLEGVKKQRAENRDMLKSLGILNKRVENGSNVDQRKNAKRKSSATDMPCRKSSRLLGKEPLSFVVSENEVVLEENLIKKTSNKHTEKRENTFGAIYGVPMGMHFETRLEASHAGIHRPTVAGIHGDTVLGCYSLALSGGYAEDVDSGDSFVYTGEGGRNLKGTKTNPKNLRTAPQTKDQVLERGNLALSKSLENNNPIRVLRGYKLNSMYAPTEGYRYDGLYKVVKYSTAPGVAGFKVYKFYLERLKNQDPAPWAVDFKKIS